MQCTTESWFYCINFAPLLVQWNRNFFVHLGLWTKYTTKSRFHCVSEFVDKVHNKIMIFCAEGGGVNTTFTKKLCFLCTTYNEITLSLCIFFSLKCTLELRLCCIVCNRVQLPLHNFLYFFMYIRGEFVSKSQFFCVTKTPKKHRINISLCNFCTT